MLRERAAAKMPPMYYETIREMKKLLGQLELWFDAASAHAKAKSFDPNLDSAGHPGGIEMVMVREQSSRSCLISRSTILEANTQGPSRRGIRWRPISRLAASTGCARPCMRRRRNIA